MHRVFFTAATAFCLMLASTAGRSADQGVARSGHVWKQIIVDAEKLGLSTKFLKAVPAEFVTFEFGDLQAFAAEYHLKEHRMVLNRTLSFNVAGGTLRPLIKLTHAELETLFHELFHAYMDYLTVRENEGEVDPLLSFARQEQRCRYSTVLITPVVQRKSITEERFLSQGESWEALNEAWAVFVGWTVWNQLELRQQMGRSIQKPGKSRQAWLRRLEEADREGKIRGYYEPEETAERAVTRKRFLAQESRLSAEEIKRLLADPLEFSADLVEQAAVVMTRNQQTLLSSKACQ